MELKNGAKLLYFVISTILSVTILRLLLTLLSTDVSQMPAIVVRLLLYAGLSVALHNGLQWARYAMGIVAAIDASAGLFIAVYQFSVNPSFALVFVLFGIAYLVSALILFGAQSLRTFMAEQQKSRSG